jgi:hypothetical protein
MDYGRRDRIIGYGRWPSGNHFWFRSRILSANRRFLPIWTTEPQFTLQLHEEGRQGIVGPDAVAGHRIQPGLLDKAAIRKRAIKVGRAFANLRLRGHRTVKQAILLRKHPVLMRVFCGVTLFKWSLLYLQAIVLLSGDLKFEKEVTALERMANYLEMLRIAKYCRSQNLSTEGMI